ncbi:MAG: hypothetical protein HWE10_05995 [Gammaproteobacteria bacterium]|nr:hypothetical protein [Gammaproteobacteria bacterium]
MSNKLTGVQDINQSEQVCDVTALKCPMAFVRAKQALLHYQTKVFLFNDDVSLYNFCQYLDKQSILYKKNAMNSTFQIDVLQNERNI